MRREWQLRREDGVRAVLQLPMFRSGGRAEVGGRHLLIERHGLFRPEYSVIDEDVGAVVASVRPGGRRRVLELDQRIYEWKRLGRKSGFGFVGNDGQPLLIAKVRSGVFRSGGSVHVDASTPEREGLLAAVLAAFLLIRRNEQQAASATAATTAATS